MALPKSFKQMPENFTPGDPLEAAAAETVEALKQAPGRWHQARRFRTIEAAADFSSLLENYGAETECKGVIVYARALPSTITVTPVPDPSAPSTGTAVTAPMEFQPGEVIDTSERRGRGRAS